MVTPCRWAVIPLACSMTIRDSRASCSCSGATVTDARAVELRQLASGPLPDAVRLVLKALDPELAADEAVVAAVLAQARQLGRS